MVAWDVFIDGKLTDTVFFSFACDKEYLIRSLIMFDGLPDNIEVKIKY
jgi:hypothetical protein